MSKAERGLLVLLALWSVVPLGLLTPAAPAGGMFLGAEGLQLGDQLQYMAWIRDAGEHVLFSNRYDTVADPHLFLHPMWALSGLAWRAGASVQLAFLAWAPVAAATLFAGYALYVRRMVAGAGRRAAALALALFFFPPAAWLGEWAGAGSPDFRFGSLTMGLELFPAGLLWGIFPTAIALGLMPAFLLGLERVLDPDHRPQGRSLPRHAIPTALAGLVVSWLHPWQGVTLLMMLGGLVAWSRLRRDCLLLTLPAAATAAPLGYYWALGRTDSAWSLVSLPNDMPHLGAWLFACVGTALLLALPGVRLRPEGIHQRLLLLWPLAALAVYFTLQRSFFYHALAGLSLPLAVLGVRGFDRLRLPAPAAVAAVALLTLPGLAFVLDEVRQVRHQRFLGPDEAAVIDYLRESPRAGAVLAPVELGRTVPAHAGRNTWVGHPTWTPANPVREAQAEALFSGRLRAPEARRLVEDAHVAFLAAGCGHRRTRLEPLLGPLVVSVRRFGCATVYELREQA